MCVRAVDPNTIQFECQRLWHIRGLSFNLTWLLPDYLRFGNVIHQFVVALKLTDGTENVSILIDNATISFQDLKVLIKIHESQTYNKIMVLSVRHPQ